MFFRSTCGQNGPRGRVLHEFCRPKPKLRKRTKHEFWVKRGGLGAFVSKKINYKFFRSTSGQNGTRGRVLHQFCRPKPKLRKCTKHEFWVKQGGLGVFILEKSTASFFASTVARIALGGEFRTTFVYRNRNFENTPNMSFESNRVDWLRLF
jgi:hypothetical protein